ncbi:cation channel sperm-associated protein 4-like [Clytia hemisphaerica]|uniref:Ion transport domain-containing protein n=1 Tax=Clytia hemisphaerica TaxID=252671 RepID=A0A7M5UXW5_9CNID|eukprot:TCONS_00070677-protein
MAEGNNEIDSPKGAERFRNAARKVSKLSATVDIWQQQAKTLKSGLDIPTVPRQRRMSVMDSFKSAVDKVKMKKKIASFLEPEYDPSIFRTIFQLGEDNGRRVTVFQETLDDQKPYVHLRDLPPMSNNEVAEFVSKELVGKVVESRCFRFTILFLIIVNSLLIMLETDRTLEREWGRAFKIMDEIIMSVFICEILLKWYHGFFKFFTQGWNILDFLIVLSLIVGPMIMGGSGGQNVLRILRVLRAFRSLRSISSLPGLQVVVQTILQSVPDMTNIVLLLVIIMLVFSVIGITLFREVMPHHFGDLSTAMFSLFICVTQDGWMEIFEAFQQHGDLHYYGGGLFLVLFISIGAFIFANLVVAVVVTNLECAVKDVREEEQMQAKQLALKGGDLGDKVNNIPVDLVNDDQIPNRVFQEQAPLVIPNLTGVDIRNIEHYCLVLEAMERNLHAYQQLKSDLVKYHDEICILNKSAIAEGVIKYDDDLARKNTIAKESALLAYQKVASGGDIVSNLMNMENASLINSKSKTALHDLVTESANIRTRLGSMAGRNATGRRRSSVRALRNTTEAVKNVNRRASLGF